MTAADADWMTIMMTTTAIFVTVGSHLLSAKLAANRQSLRLRGNVGGAEGEGKVRGEVFEVVGVSPAVFKRGFVIGRRVESPTVRVVGLLDSPQEMNVSRSRIH